MIAQQSLRGSLMMPYHLLSEWLWISEWVSQVRLVLPIEWEFCGFRSMLAWLKRAHHVATARGNGRWFCMPTRAESANRFSGKNTVFLIRTGLWIHHVCVLEHSNWKHSALGVCSRPATGISGERMPKCNVVRCDWRSGARLSFKFPRPQGLRHGNLLIKTQRFAWACWAPLRW